MRWLFSFFVAYSVKSGFGEVVVERCRGRFVGQTCVRPMVQVQALVHPRPHAGPQYLTYSTIWTDKNSMRLILPTF